MFDAVRHDFGPKIFLGHSIRASGVAEGEEALGLLARMPATAHHIAFELAQYFVADASPPALVDRLAARFRDSDGDIRAVLKTLFTSREFRDSARYGSRTCGSPRREGPAVDAGRSSLSLMVRVKPSKITASPKPPASTTPASRRTAS